MNNYKIIYEQAYCKYFDITIIMKFKYKDNELLKQEISGWYCGLPDSEGLETFKEKGVILELEVH